KLRLFRAEQANDKANLAAYSNEFARAKQLFEAKNPQSAAAGLDQAKTKYEAMLATVQQRETLLSEYEAILKEVSAKDEAKLAKISEAKKEAPKQESEPAVQAPAAPPPPPIPQPEIQTRDNAFSTFSLNVSDV